MKKSNHALLEINKSEERQRGLPNNTVLCGRRHGDRAALREFWKNVNVREETSEFTPEVKLFLDVNYLLFRLKFWAVLKILAVRARLFVLFC